MSKEDRNKSKFSLPDVWTDDDEMYSLMQRIKRPRHIDPLNYERKISFWQQLIENYAMHNRVVAVNEIELLRLFSRNFVADRTIMHPECLPQVLNAMVETGALEIGRKQNILTKVAELTYDWIFKNTISWTWSYFAGNNEPTKPIDQRNYGSSAETLILTKNLSQFSEEFVEYIIEQCRSIIPHGYVYIHDDFEALLIKYFSHDLSRYVIKNYIQEKGLIRIEHSTPIKLVFLKNYASAAMSKDLDSTVLSSIANLRITMHKLQAEELRLSTELSSRKAQIKQLLRESRKSEALNHLRRSKQLEAELTRKMQQITNLENLEMQIGAAKNNQTVILAMSDAGSALKRATGGLEGLAEAERTMDEMADLIEDTHMISNTLAHVDEEETNSDLETELEQLLQPLTPKHVPVESPAKPTASISPNTSISPKNIDDDDELLRQLKALELITLDDLSTLPTTAHENPVAN